jgi:2'-5' RNA ligase
VKKRLFIGVDISEKARSAVESYISELSGRFSDLPVKWEKPEKLHLTLKFLGNTEEDIIDRVFDIVDRNAKGTDAFELEIAGTGAFPSAKNARILWLGVNEPTGVLKDLVQRIDDDCSKLGFEIENRSFKPHLTIARIRDPRSSSELGKEHTTSDFGPIGFSCRQLVLYHSQLGRGGSVYTKLAAARFQKK